MSSDATDSLYVWQLSDTHFFQDPSARLMGVDTWQTFHQVLAEAKESDLIPDLILLTGDLSQDEKAGSYERLADELSRLARPVFFLPGNHDDADLMSEVFSRYEQFSLERMFCRGAWGFALLNSKVGGQISGRVSKEELARLESFLRANRESPIMVCLHHQPVPMGSAWLDELGLENQEEFWQLVDRWDNVRAVVWGHVHQEFAGRRSSKLLLATPSTCLQFLPGSATFAADTNKPGYRYFRLFADGTIDTGVRRAERVAMTVERGATGY